MKKPTIANKPLLAALLAVVATCSVAPSLYATEPEAGTQPSAAAGAPAAGTAFPSPEEVVSRLQTKLSLTAEQTSALTPIIASPQERLKGVLSDSSARPLKRRRELRTIVAESDKQINALLSPAQQKEYAQIEKQLHEELKQRMQERRNAGAG
ncbi:MAG: hypothetical protein JWO04_5012 [Gammaproteobacteria bacterium]|nr:hypothetical protein [Gammaproteobacteria bacterium]